MGGVWQSEFINSTRLSPSLGNCLNISGDCSRSLESFCSVLGEYECTLFRFHFDSGKSEGPFIPTQLFRFQTSRSRCLAHAVSADGSMLAIATTDRLHVFVREGLFPVVYARAWDYLIRTETRSLHWGRTHRGSVLLSAANAYGVSIFALRLQEGADGSIQFRLSQLSTVRPNVGTFFASCCSFSYDDDWLGVGSLDGRVFLWQQKDGHAKVDESGASDIPEWVLVQTLELHPEPFREAQNLISAIEFSRSGRYLAIRWSSGACQCFARNGNQWRLCWDTGKNSIVDLSSTCESFSNGSTVRFLTWLNVGRSALPHVLAELRIEAHDSEDGDILVLPFERRILLIYCTTPHRWYVQKSDLGELALRGIGTFADFVIFLDWKCRLVVHRQSLDSSLAVRNLSMCSIDGMDGCVINSAEVLCSAKLKKLMLFGSGKALAVVWERAPNEATRWLLLTPSARVDMCAGSVSESQRVAIIASFDTDKRLLCLWKLDCLAQRPDVSFCGKVAIPRDASDCCRVSFLASCEDRSHFLIVDDCFHHSQRIVTYVDVHEMGSRVRLSRCLIPCVSWTSALTVGQHSPTFTSQCVDEGKEGTIKVRVALRWSAQGNGTVSAAQEFEAELGDPMAIWCASRP
ncbi:hypothetical protein FVE85_1659 [Porphyridium purpureum]|uniref:Uncharacterized protein n=1 Tax=Porphyridium purpureum TaxID=35688 RepID=A0A5J4YXV4_PORPP|nr:hypothetical protein FVE85_1659 [Porphyridium purpureum]|eukprot:POR6922..scf209_3